MNSLGHWSPLILEQTWIEFETQLVKYGEQNYFLSYYKKCIIYSKG